MTENGGTPIDSWERWDGVSDEAFQAFEEYRLMGLSRSIVKVSEKLSKSESLINRWNTRDQWRRRVVDWDRHHARETNRKLYAGAAAMREQHANVARALAAKITQRIMNMTEKE